MDEIDKNISFKRPKSDKAKNLTFFMFKREEIENKEKYVFLLYKFVRVMLFSRQQG